MKHILNFSFLVVSSALLMLAGCKKEAEPRPLADISILSGKWISNTGMEVDINSATRQGVLTKIPANDVYGRKIGDVQYKNIEAVDANTFRGETRFTSTTGYHLFTDVKITVENDVMFTVSNVGSLGAISVTGQMGQLKRVR
jgi:hypothetical protein